MQLAETLSVGNGRIELLHGDLTDLPPELSVDLLIISAFPDDYRPTSSSVVGALDRRGLSVAELAERKAEDLRETCASWVSSEISPGLGLGFSRLLCFEPRLWGEPPEVVGDVFRALIPVLGQNASIRSVAMPILSSGDQGYSVAEAFPPLLEASLRWLQAGLPLDTIRIVAHSDEDLAEARGVFGDFRIRAQEEMSLDSVGQVERADTGFDVFISYSHKDTEAALHFEEELLRLRPDLRIFLDRKELRVGSAWQVEIFESLDRCHFVAALLSPSYVSSKVCKEEFNIAWVRGRDADEEILFPLYVLSSAPLPTYMKYKQYLDCREADLAGIATAAAGLLSALDRKVG